MVADAVGGYPVIVRDISSPTDDTAKVVNLSNKDYKYKNCAAIWLPLFNAALLITRSGTAKVANCSPQQNSWTVHELNASLHFADYEWRYSSLGVSKDGYRAFALDRRGKLLIVEFDSA